MPKRISHYELHQTLGRGTFSKVKYAVDTESNKAFAIKIVDRKQVKKENMENQLKREIAIMKTLKHPFIVGLKEVLQTSKRIYIVLELVTGGELFDRIVRAKRFDEDTARKFFQHLIMGIVYCHEKGIAHRDLKPENLLVDDQDNLKISDFGLSALTDAGGGKLLMTTCGTPNYVAPEVLLEKGYDGFSADIWSAGVILFVMLAGYLPFDDSSMDGLFAKIEKGKFKMPRHLSSGAKNLISGLLVVKPKDRMNLTDIVKDPWFKTGYASLISQVDQQIQEFDVDAKNAFTTTNDISGQSKEEDNGEARHSFNAFELASKLMLGTLNPLMSVTSTVIRRETRFMASESPEKLAKTIGTVLKDSGATLAKSKTDEIKAFYNTSKGMVKLTVVLFPTIASDLCMVEFRRTLGDTLMYNDYYRAIYKKLVDLQIVSANKL